MKWNNVNNFGTGKKIASVFGTTSIHDCTET